jgi:hypothetical protein
LDSIPVDEQVFKNFFDESLTYFKSISDSASEELQMYDFFVENYKHKHLFHDYLHPTNLFLYEIFRRIVKKLWSIDLPCEDEEFLKKLKFDELCEWAQPILPPIKKHLGMTTSDVVPLFKGAQMIYVDCYDYYYIRMLPDNFYNYLKLKSDI